MNLTETAHNVRHSLTDIIHTTLHGKPDVIIMGETHTDLGAAREQARRIRRHKPEYVLLEGLNDATPEDPIASVELFKYATLAELLQKADLSPTQTGIEATTVHAMGANCDERFSQLLQLYIDHGVPDDEKRERAIYEADGTIPVTTAHMLKTPVYDLHPDAFDALREAIGVKVEEYESQGHYQLAGQVHAISRLMWELSKAGRSDKRFAIVRHAAAQVNARLAGCDIEKNLPKFEDNGNTGEILASEEERQECPEIMEQFLAFRQYVNDHNEEREEVMGQKMTTYVSERTTTNPVVAIIGNGHTRPDSGIYEQLKNAGVNFRTIRHEAPSASVGDAITYIQKLVK